jgi:hypothetical protein
MYPHHYYINDTHDNPRIKGHPGVGRLALARSGWHVIQLGASA